MRYFLFPEICNIMLNALTVMLLVSFNVSWRHTARGLCLTINTQFIHDWGYAHYSSTELVYLSSGWNYGN